MVRSNISGVRKRLALGSLVLGAAVALVVTGGVSAKPTTAKKAQAGPLVALLLPENVTPRWEGSDKPTFIAALKKLVPGVQIDSLNALNSSSTQQSQAEAELTKGAKVLVVAAVDQKAAAVIVNEAHAKGVPVVAYDRLIRNSPLAYYDSFNGVAVGAAQGKWLLAHVKAGANIAVINGSPTDDNAHLFNQGYMKYLTPAAKAGKIHIVANQWTPGWDPPTAQREMEQILTKQGNKIDGVLSANDGMAGGIISALKAQGLTVPVTGQDASLEGIQNIVQGTQGMSVFKDFRLQAPAAATIVGAILSGKTPSNINAKTPNGQVQVPSVIITPVAIDGSNLKTLVTNGWITSQFGGLSKVCKGLPKKSICS